MRKRIRNWWFQRRNGFARWTNEPREQLRKAERKAGLR